jgi:hypothetical protein
MNDVSLPRRLWHASRANIERPTLAGRTEGENHANSGLGIYCATKPANYIASFGAFIHELTLRPDVRVMRMTISELSAMGWVKGEPRERDWFEQEGRRLGQSFDLIELIEISGLAEQAIVLNDSAILECKVQSAEAFLAGFPPEPVRSGPKL